MNPEIQCRSLKVHVLVLILCHVAISADAASSFTNETDFEALVAFKRQITSDPSDVLSSWNSSIHFCAWTGITCGKKHRRVTAIRLPSRMLVGILSPNIWNLTFLRVINLDDNKLNGTLPQEIGFLRRLQALRLANNYFVGELPRNITACADLRVLYLSGNNLRGEIPNELGSLVKLTTLYLSSNKFTGEMPPALGNLSALTSLILSTNHIKGSIPPQLGHLSKLELLQLGDNNLSGHFPDSILNMSSIVGFAIPFNSFEGSLPSDMFLSLPNLEKLFLAANGFSGLVPSSISNASRALGIDLSRNNFVGSVPAGLEGLRNLQFLNLEINKLGTEDGDDLSFLTSFANSTNLQELAFSQNRLRGELPESISNFSSNFTVLRLGRNLISGTIPSGLANLVNLQFLVLRENMLTGMIPGSFGTMSNLQILDLGQNKLSGVIPSSLGNLTTISTIFLEENRLEGTIPASLGKCKGLNSLALRDNLLVGGVPEEIFGLSSLSEGLSLAGNQLTGPIPSLVSKLVNLMELELSENNLTGEIPKSLGDCVMLEYLYLGSNQLDGTVPLAMSNLRGLKLLDLSRNNFSGHIPEFLGELPFIERLDLSFNKFDGKVPDGKIFDNLTVVSVVGNIGLCGGPASLQLLECKEEVAEKGHRGMSSKRKVLVVTLSVSCFFLLVGILTVILCVLKKSKSGTVPASSSMDHHPKVSYGELSQATNGFSPANMIGEGNFGAVYKGILPVSGEVVAVKVLKLEEKGANKSFMAECEALRNIRHRNLVKIITSCSGIDFRGEDFKALVFEFMPNGSLEKWLHPVLDETRDAGNNISLSLTQRLNIAIDVATALNYLQHQCHICIVHSDLKPSNVLLDDDFSAHVSDFGISKILMDSDLGTQTSTIGVRGTIGYVAPEYGVGGEVSTRGDMYSFGILLLELFMGKRPTESIFGGESVGLRDFAQKSLPDGLIEVVDPLLCLERVQGNIRQCLLSVLRVGLMCSASQPNDRMDIGEAAAELHKARDILQSRIRRTRT